MRSILSFLFIFIFALNTLATPLPPYSSMSLQFTGVDSQSGQELFVFIIPDGKELTPNALYYFNSDDGVFQAVYGGKDREGRSILNGFESVETKSGYSKDSFSGPSFGLNFDQTHKNATGAAIRTGMTRAIYRGLIDTDKHHAELEKYRAQTAADIQAIEKNYQQISDGLGAEQEQFKTVLANFKNTLVQNPFTEENQNFVYKSPDVSLVKDLTEIEQVLRSVRATSPRARQARDWGLVMVQNSDAASAQGDAQEAIAYRRYAEGFLDIAVGIDPVTGVIRDVYEAFTGTNLVTGEELGNFDRSFAIIGALTFGFGSKMGKGLKIFDRLRKTKVLEQSIVAVTKIFSRMAKEVTITENIAHNAATYQKYLRELRGEMERPVVSEAKLKEYVEEIYWKETSRYGNGSTAAAIRFELTTGQQVGNKWHSQKGQGAIIFFERWLAANPLAKASDRRAAENLILDLRDTFGGMHE